MTPLWMFNTRDEIPRMNFVWLCLENRLLSATHDEAILNPKAQGHHIGNQIVIMFAKPELRNRLSFRQKFGRAIRRFAILPTSL